MFNQVIYQSTTIHFEGKERLLSQGNYTLIQDTILYTIN